MQNGIVNFSAETLGLAKSALNPNKLSEGDLAKTISTSTGLVYYDLQAPSKNLYPIITPLRNSIARVARPGDRFGTATHWKVVSAINGSGYNSMGWVPEGQRSGRMSYDVEDKSCTYVTLGEEDSITFEAESAAQGFEDVNATSTMRLLQKMMSKEEFGILGGNRSVALGTPTAPTVGSGGSGSFNTTYYMKVVALTLEGYNNSSLSGGVATSQVITGADGNTYTLNGGSSAASTSGSTAASSAAYLTGTTPVVNGAVAYAWYVGTVNDGTMTLEAITLINSVKLTALTGTGQAVSAITGDHSKNATLAFDGLLYTAYGAGSNAYINALATGTAGTGTYLSASGYGTITEIDDMMKSMWDNYRVSPTVIYVSSQELTNVTNGVLTGSSGAPLLRYQTQSGDGQRYKLTAGGVIEMYFNPYTGQMIPVKIHPNLPAGTLVGWCEQLPAWYQSNNVPNVAEVITRRDYYRIDWPLRTRQREYGVYAEEVLAVYAPFAMGIITNIANGITS